MADTTLLSISRICLGLIFFIDGVIKAITFDNTVGFMKQVGIPFAEAACVLSIIILIGCSFLIFRGRKVRPASLVLIAWLAIVTLTLHTNFPEGMMAFLKNIAIIGGLFALAANH